MRISVLVSGGGTNLQAIIDAIEDGRIREGKIVQVISSKEGAYALERAAKAGIPAKVISKDLYPDREARMKALREALDEKDTDLVVLAGYLSILTAEVLRPYKGRIINIHPSLLPKHGGKDCYGIHVHERVIGSGDEKSGATVHYVDEGIDTGEIIIQESLDVHQDDTPESLQKRVLEIEHRILPEAINKLASEKQGKKTTA